MNIKSILNINKSSNFGRSFNKALNVAKTSTLSLALSTAPLSSAKSSIYDIPKCYIYSKAPLLKDYKGDHISYYLFEAARDVLRTDITTGVFNGALKNNKKSLMKDLKINRKTYDSYTELTKVIGQEERSLIDLGDPGCTSSVFDVNTDVISPVSSELSESINPYFTSKLNYTPIDVERFTVKDPTDAEKLLFNKYGVNFDDPNISPEKRAIGTIIHLSRLEKEYPEYLRQHIAQRPDFEDKAVQASLKNAEKIMSDEILGPFAISELDANARELSMIMDDIGELHFNLLSKKDLNDLRLYASSIVLSKEMYMVERWDNHPVLPVGENKDAACANILSLLIAK